MGFNIKEMLEERLLDVKRLVFLSGSWDDLWDCIGPKGSSTIYGVIALGVGVTKA